MRVRLAFGRSGVELNLPDGFRYRVLESRSAEALEDPESGIEAALDLPVGSLPLSELARGKRTAAISICDITRPAPYGRTLPPVLRRLREAGIRREDVTILIATGLHRGATPAEIREICGEDIASSYHVGKP